jgi:hypothetical protein
MSETSVLDQKPKKPAAEKSNSGEQSVLGGSSKPITFYKKPWFWIIIAVVVLGGAGLGIFLGINASLTAEAIEKYTDNAKAADDAAYEFERSFANIYSDSGLSGYYSDSNERSISLRNKCAGEFGISEDTMKDIDDIDSYADGEEMVEKVGAGKTRELSDKFADATDKLKEAKKNITKCEDMLKKALEDDVEIKLGSFTAKKISTYRNETGMKVTVKNTGDTSHSYYFKVVAKKSSGTQIDSDSVYTKTLSAGESAEFTVFDYVYSSDIEDMKKAEFSIESLSED